MKQILKIIAGMIGGGVIGLAIAALIIWLTDGAEAIKVLSERKDVDVLKLILATVGSLLGMVIAVIFHFLVHETGHLVCGLATGFRVVSFRVLKYTLVKDNGRFRLKQFDIQGTGGQCIMTLAEDTDPNRVPYFWYNAGGVLANLTLAALSAGTLTLFDCNKPAEIILFQLVFVGILFALLNGLPISMGGISNDGQNILTLCRSTQEQRYFMHMMQTVAALSEGRRLRELPEAWFEENHPTSIQEYFAVANRINYISWLEDQGRFSEALQVCEELMAWENPLPVTLRMEVAAEQITLEQLTSVRREVIEKLWTDQLKKYVEANSCYSAPKMVTRIAVAFAIEQDKNHARVLYQQLEKSRDKFVMQGEVKTALFLAEQLFEQNR